MPVDASTIASASIDSLASPWEQHPYVSRQVGKRTTPAWPAYVKLVLQERYNRHPLYAFRCERQRQAELDRVDVAVVVFIMRSGLQGGTQPAPTQPRS